MSAGKAMLAAATLLAVQAVAATDLRFGAPVSELSFEGRYGGEAVAGTFTRFSGEARVDPAAPTRLQLRAEIDVASLDTDYPDRDEVLRGADWFDATTHPRATWVSTGPCAVVATGLECPGELTLRGVARPVPLALAWSGSTTLAGEARLDRRDFGIGSGEWDADGSIGDGVTVRFRLDLLPR